MKKKKVRKPRRKPNHECDQIDVFCEECGSLNVHQNDCSKFVERNEEIMDETEGMYFDVFCEECGSLNTHQNYCAKFLEHLVENVDQLEFIQDDNITDVPMLEIQKEVSVEGQKCTSSKIPIEIANSKVIFKSLDDDIPSPAYSPVHPKAKQNVVNARICMSGYKIPKKDKAQSLVHASLSEVPSPAYSPIHPKISSLEVPSFSNVATDEKNKKLGVYFDSSGSYNVLPRYKKKRTNKGQYYDAMGKYTVMPYKKKAKRQRIAPHSQIIFDKFERKHQVDVERMQQVEVDESNNTVTLRYMEISGKKAELTMPLDQIENVPGIGVDQYLSQMRQMCSNHNM